MVRQYHSQGIAVRARGSESGAELAERARIVACPDTSDPDCTCEFGPYYVTGSADRISKFEPYLAMVVEHRSFGHGKSCHNMGSRRSWFQRPGVPAVGTTSGICFQWSEAIKRSIS